MEGPWSGERAANPPMLALLMVVEGPWSGERAANPPMLALLQVLEGQSDTGELHVG